jgi:hypothetical protein
MSRRHPLSSTRALWEETGLTLVCRLKALVTRRHQGRRHPLKDESYFFLATLRVFFAVFFTALFAFFAFLAMLPS